MPTSIDGMDGVDACALTRPLAHALYLPGALLVHADISTLHLYESLGFWRAGAELRKVHFAEEWNEMHHLQVRWAAPRRACVRACVRATRACVRAHEEGPWPACSPQGRACRRVCLVTGARMGFHQLHRKVCGQHACPALAMCMRTAAASSTFHAHGGRACMGVALWAIARYERLCTPALACVAAGRCYTYLHGLPGCMAAWLQIMESLGGDRLWFDRFLAEHAAVFYYWVMIGEATPCHGVT